MSEGSAKKRKGAKREKTTTTTNRFVKRQASEEPREELTQEEYERRKAKILRRAILIENQYNMLRLQLKDKKLKQAVEYKIQAAEGKSPEYLIGKQEAEVAFEKKNQRNLLWRDMKLAQIRDEYEAEMEMNKTQFDDQYAYEKGRYIDYFTALIAEKQRRADMVGNFLGAFLSLPPVPTKETEQPVLTKEAYEGRTTRSRSKSVKKEEEVVERRGRKPKKQIPEKEKMSKRIKEKRKTP